MQIAREIQRSLFRATARGSTASGGGQAGLLRGRRRSLRLHPLGDERWALAIADVSGKGAPASILMASVHASLRALAGSARPDQLMVRLNRFLFESTQENKYVPLFYAELDPARRRLAYVNAGHVPPFWLGADQWRARLGVGGPVLGLLESAQYDMAEVQLGPGELVAMVTDGATEALSPDDEEFGEDRLRALQSNFTERSPLMPELPTIIEAGQPKFPIGPWFALVGPAGLPPAIVTTMNKAMVAALAKPTVREQMQRHGFIPRSSTPEELAVFMKEQLPIWKTALRAAGMEPQ